MDYASPFPKFERLKNYIQFINNQKYIEESKNYAAGTKNGKNSIISALGKKVMKPAEQFEAMQRIKAEIMRSKTSNLKSNKHSDVTSLELKFEELGVEL